MPGLVPPSLTVACRVRLVDGWHHRCGRARSAFRFVGVIVASLHIVGDVLLYLCGVLRTNEEGARGVEPRGNRARWIRQFQATSRTTLRLLRHH